MFKVVLTLVKFFYAKTLSILRHNSATPFNLATLSDATQIEMTLGVRKLTGENLKVALAKFSALS